MANISDISYNVYLPSEEKTVGGKTEGTAADPLKEGGTAGADPTRTKNEKSELQKLMSMITLMSVGKQAAAQATASIGTATGDYNAQTRVQELMGLSATFVGIAMSDPATAAVAIAGIAISTTAQAYKTAQEVKKQNYTAEQNARRYGTFYTGGNR